MRFMCKILSFMLLPIMLMASDYNEQAQAIKDAFNKVLELYKEGKDNEAKKQTQQAYFGHFENLEAGVRLNLGSKKSYDMEKQFGQIRKAIVAKESYEQIKARIDALNAQIDEVLPIINSGHRLNAQSDLQISLTDDNPWNAVLESIQTQIQNTKTKDPKNDKQAILTALNELKMDLYRNSGLEIAVRRYGGFSFGAIQKTGKAVDANIQQAINELIRSVASGQEISDFNQALVDIDELISTTISRLPQDSYALAPKQENKENFKDYTSVVENIRSRINKAIALYDEGKIDEAIEHTQNAYFDEYEASGMENTIGGRDGALKLSTEASFNALNAAFNAGDENAIQKAKDELFAQLEKSLELTGKNSAWDIFLYALIIILREGFEALIIVTAVILYLLKTKNEKRLNIVYSALSVALILSVITAYAMSLIFGTQMAAQSREILEGAVMLVATVLLFYVGFWLLSNANAKKWNAYISSQVQNSLSKQDSKMLWWVVFLAVYREGAETVLFYTALVLDASDKSSGLGMVAAGFCLGVVLLAISYVILKIFALKIPIKPFFLATSAMIFYMSIAFTGKGVMELIEGKLFVGHSISAIPTLPWLGLYPYYESLVPQALMILALIFGLIYTKQKQTQS